MSGSSQVAVNATVTASPLQGLTVEGDFRKREDVRNQLKAIGLKWNSTRRFWFLPKGRELSSSELDARARRLANVLKLEFGVPTELRLGDQAAQRGRLVTGAVSGFLPAVDPVPMLQVGDGRWVGSRHEATIHLPTSAITTMLRADITTAKRSGLLPAGLTTSVRKHEFAGGWEIHVRVLDWRTPWRYIDPADGSSWTDPTVEAIVNTLKVITFQYNRLDLGLDYRKHRFHQSVKMGETCNQQEVLASPSHPMFKTVPYKAAWHTSHVVSLAI